MDANSGFQASYEKESFRTKTSGIGSGAMADSNRETIFGIAGDSYKKTSCEIPYDADNTETLYILGWEPDLNRAIEKDREKEEAKGAAPKAGFRFKQLTKERHGYKVKLGSSTHFLISDDREHFIHVENELDPRRCRAKAFEIVASR